MAFKDLDYASIERRIAAIKPAGVSAVQAMQAFGEAAKNLDPAKKFASELLNKPYDEVTHEERKKAKKHPAFFLKMYGGQPPKR